MRFEKKAVGLILPSICLPDRATLRAAMASAKTAGRPEEPEKVIVTNRRARFDYDVEDVFEGGLVLLGSEVKSLRLGRAEIVDAFAAVERGELWLKQLHIAPFEQANAFPHEPRRARKVLVHASEIAKIDRALSREGYTLVPLRIYWKQGRVKVELGLAKGKKTHDKRADIKAKTADREAKVAMGRARKERGR